VKDSPISGDSIHSDPLTDQQVTGPALRGWLLLTSGIAVCFIVQAVWRTVDSSVPLLSTPVYQLDINRAGEADLLNLPEVGPTLARNIVRHREQFGPLQSADDLESVPGVGPQTLKQLLPFIVFAPGAEDCNAPTTSDTLLTAQSQE
jgi:competence ComEA-like helix-hairpin-helix protein